MRHEDDWAAITTTNQFISLGLYADYCKGAKHIWTAYQRKLNQRERNKINISFVKAQLVNSWNTERLLKSTYSNFSGPGSGFVAQWAFPQAYYSAFNSTLASFETSGYTEHSHAAVRKKVSNLASLGALPKHLNIWVDGSKKELRLEGISSTWNEFSSTSLYPDNIENIKRHLMSFFKTTREMHLEDKKGDLRVKTKDGKKLKKAFNQNDWRRVSNALAKTSWLCLLYRKRIKSNYKVIDTFLSDDFATHDVLYRTVN
jgi:uncharacterized protein (UPF0332 family)